jgi:ubiquinone/menaquinone biosynthesis C-methylase UbiE
MASRNFDRLASFLCGFIPVLSPPDQISARVRTHYHSTYAEIARRADLNWKKDCRLEPIETEIFDRHRIHSGKMLVLGSGWGREAIAIAQRGVEVVGMDTDFTAVRTARELAKAAGVSARFHQADFLELPYASSSFDFALMSHNMYSAIPGSSRRQAWLADLDRLLKPNGLVMLSFLPEQLPVPRLRRLSTSLNATLAKLPGTNRDYQPGDDCVGEHFIHWFEDMDEIRKELDGAGVTILEINWEGMAVVTHSRASSSSPIS